MSSESKLATIPPVLRWPLLILGTALALISATLPSLAVGNGSLRSLSVVIALAALAVFIDTSVRPAMRRNGWVINFVVAWAVDAAGLIALFFVALLSFRVDMVGLYLAGALLLVALTLGIGTGAAAGRIGLVAGSVVGYGAFNTALALLPSFERIAGLLWVRAALAFFSAVCLAVAWWRSPAVERGMETLCSALPEDPKGENDGAC